ncbi:MAG: RNA polymerase sigma factor [Candidatus Sungbacteria bacterium]|nr:RNA polymerase sigma factor [Candidatus Sungbacteria bacterium]
MSLDPHDSLKTKENSEGQSRFGKGNGMADEVLLASSEDDPQLFEILVRRYQEPFLRAAGRVVHRREDAEDIVQEAFLKIYRNAGKFVKQEGIEFKSWAYRVVLNTSFTHYQRLKKRGICEEDDGEESLINVISENDDIKRTLDVKMLIERVLVDMPEDLARVLRRHYLEDKAYETIAGEDKTTIASIKMRLYRARKQFKKLADTSRGSIKKKADVKVSNETQPL